MQISTTRHSSRFSNGRAAGCRYSVAGSDVNRDTSRTRVSGGGVGRESGKGASTTGASTADTPARTKAVSRGAGSTVAASAAGTAADATASVDDTGSAAAPSPRGTAASATTGAGGLRWDVATAATEAIAGASGAPTAPTSGLEVVAPRVAPRFPLGVAIFSMPDHSKLPSLAAPQPARVTVPHNSTSANCRDFSTRSPPSNPPFAEIYNASTTMESCRNGGKLLPVCNKHLKNKGAHRSKLTTHDAERRFEVSYDIWAYRNAGSCCPGRACKVGCPIPAFVGYRFGCHVGRLG